MGKETKAHEMTDKISIKAFLFLPAVRAHTKIVSFSSVSLPNEKENAKSNWANPY